jgi:outer membrane receptor for ferrienterochelin and colicin
MKKNSVSLGVMAALLATGGLAFQGALAQDGDDEFIEEIVTTGTRSAKPRSASDSPVPVDVLSADDFTAMGNTADLTDNIKALVPSYTATPATGDGSAFVRPTSLRGTAPDQTLVLINGKRRHATARMASISEWFQVWLSSALRCCAMVLPLSTVLTRSLV